MKGYYMKINFYGIRKVFTALLIPCSLFLIPYSLSAADPMPPIFVRPSIFSTSTDWEAVTGLRLHMYSIRVSNAAPAGTIGWEMYFLDGFPCYAQSEGARSWVSSSSYKDARFSVTCLYAPDAVGLAWREAARMDKQGVTTGLLICPVKNDGRDMLIDLSKCTKPKDWKDI
ncbi:hypothetical protein FACS189421_14280 [Bacteroidia bacterium]|nr:hypothetical protein FACS189421_14280 [Bacteroidia bacterium]